MWQNYFSDRFSHYFAICSFPEIIIDSELIISLYECGTLTVYLAQHHVWSHIGPAVGARRPGYP